MHADEADKPSDDILHLLGRMTPEERMLVVLKRELYDGDWNAMLADLNARLEGRPYVFRLADRIADDIERVKQLRQVEARLNVDLSDYIDLDHPDRL